MTDFQIWTLYWLESKEGAKIWGWVFRTCCILNCVAYHHHIELYNRKEWLIIITLKIPYKCDTFICQKFKILNLWSIIYPVVLCWTSYSYFYFFSKNLKRNNSRQSSFVTMKIEIWNLYYFGEFTLGYKCSIMINGLKSPKLALIFRLLLATIIFTPTCFTSTTHFIIVSLYSTTVPMQFFFYF